jgi:putative endonuclease
MSTTQQYSVYILKSFKDHQNYIGLSANIEKRFKMHNAGKVRSTKSRRPFQLIFQELVGSLQEARAREKYFKSAAGRKYLQTVLSKIANDS